MSALLNRRRTYGIRAPYTREQIDAEFEHELSRIDAGQYVPYEQGATHAMYEANIAHYDRAVRICVRVSIFAMTVLASDVLGSLLGWWSL